MKAAKLRKVKNETKNEIINDEYSIQKMIKITLILIVVFGAFYLITYFVVNNRKEDKASTYTVIDSSKILLSNIFSKSEEEYYVLATMPSKYSSNYQMVDYNKLYDEYVNKYKQSDDSVTFYYVDLDDALNKNYIGKETVISNDLSELKVNDDVLFKIKNKEIENSYVGKDEIIAELSNFGE